VIVYAFFPLCGIFIFADKVFFNQPTPWRAVELNNTVEDKAGK
jgi:hypothetical protein